MNQPANGMKNGMKVMAFMNGRRQKDDIPKSRIFISFVIPAKAGIQSIRVALDFCFRRSDGFRTFYEICKYGFFALTVFLFCMIPLTGVGAPRQNAYLILLDPAHGGDDPGVLSDKLREKDMTMNMALLIRQEAQKMPGLQVQLTRSADRGMTIAERVKAAETMKADCFVSLHINAGFGKKASGYEIYFPGFRQAAPEGGDSSPILKDMARNKSLNNSVKLAQKIQSGLETVFPRKGRGLRDAPSPLLDGLTIPGLVVEIGFATHPDDRKILTGPETQRAVARALAKSFQDYFQKTPTL